IGLLRVSAEIRERQHRDAVGRRIRGGPNEIPPTNSDADDRDCRQSANQPAARDRGGGIMPPGQGFMFDHRTRCPDQGLIAWIAPIALPARKAERLRFAKSKW